jgi:hypothetical protein
LYLGSYRREIEAAYAYDFAAHCLGKARINGISEEELPTAVRTTIESQVLWILEREFKKKWEPMKLTTQ